MTVTIMVGDALARLREMPSDSVHCCVTSPPYFGLRDYGVAGQVGLETSPAAFVETIVDIFREVRRVLRSDGTLWLNLGDSYANDGKWGGHTGGKHVKALHDSPIGWNKRYTGLKPKDLIGVPWMVAFALRADGWYLRQDIVWAKPNPMPESITDRCTKAHEYLFLLSKSERYYYDATAVAEPATQNERRPSFRGGSYVNGATFDNGEGGRSTDIGNIRVAGNKTHKGVTEYERSGTDEHRTKAGLLDIAQTAYSTRNKRSVWTIATAPFPEAHFATFPPALVEPCILAGTSAKGCCPKCGAPWRRVTGKQDTGRTQKMPDGMATHAGGHDAIHREGREKGAAGNPVRETFTLGWWPGCRCDGLDAELPPYPEKPSRAKVDDEIRFKALTLSWLASCQRVNDRRREMCEVVKDRAVVPCVVLDPFGGAGTTGLVADRHQRDALLVELKPEYAEMARDRIDADRGLFARAAE